MLARTLAITLTRNLAFNHVSIDSSSKPSNRGVSNGDSEDFSFGSRGDTPEPYRGDDDDDNDRNGGYSQVRNETPSKAPAARTAPAARYGPGPPAAPACRTLADPPCTELRTHGRAFLASPRPTTLATLTLPRAPRATATGMPPCR